MPPQLRLARTTWSRRDFSTGNEAWGLPYRNWASSWMPTSMWGAADADWAQAAAANAAQHAAIRAMRLDTHCLLRTRWEHPSQTLLQRDLGRPAEDLASTADIRLANLGAIARKRFEHDFRLGRRDPDHGLCELQDRELGRVADVQGQVLAAHREQIDPADQVVHVTEAPRLGPFAEDGDRRVLLGLADEGRDRPAVVWAHPRPVGVEDADDRSVDPLLVVVGHRQRLGVALGLVVDPARPDGVHVPPVALRLRVHLRVAVHLARRRDQEARTLELREAERVVRAIRADLQRVQRHPQVVLRRRQRGEVVDEVDALVALDQNGEDPVDEDEAAVAGE